MKGSSSNELEIIREKLKALRTKKCHMIFDNLGPDQKDLIHLSELVKKKLHNLTLKEQHLQYLHPESSEALQNFFDAFYTQTSKDCMSRKYFSVNILAAVEKKKFNLRVLFLEYRALEISNYLVPIFKN
jgi:hypothetical protein